MMKMKRKSKTARLAAVILALAICSGASVTGAFAATDQTVSAGGQRVDGGTVTAAQADEMALALTNKIWVWEWVAFFVPYMSEEGVGKLAPASETSEWAGVMDYSTMTPMKPFTQAQVDGARAIKPGKTSLAKLDIDAHAQMIMQSNGQWSCVDFMIPYMTEAGIGKVKAIYAQKHGGEMPAAAAPVDGAQQKTSDSTRSGLDAQALDIMQRTGNWGYIAGYLPEMTNAGIDAVVECYNSKHLDPSEHKKASDYYG